MNQEEIKKQENDETKKSDGVQENQTKIFDASQFKEYLKVMEKVYRPFIEEGDETDVPSVPDSTKTK